MMKAEDRIELFLSGGRARERRLRSHEKYRVNITIGGRALGEQNIT